MKKKIIIASATVLFAVATFFNMNLLQSNNAGDISLESIAVMAQAQAETGNNANVYYFTNPFSNSGEYKDDYGVTWIWTHEGDWCNKKGNNCPNGKVDIYKSKKK